MGQGRAHAVKFAENGFNVVLADMLDPGDGRYQETVTQLEQLGAECRVSDAIPFITPGDSIIKRETESVVPAV